MIIYFVFFFIINYFISKITFVLETVFDVTETSHEDGYCSDPGEITTTNYTESVIDHEPSKDFVSKYCDSDGEVNYDGLVKLSDYQLCNKGSGYCGCKKILKAKKSKLVRKHTNIKDEFLDCSSESEYQSYNSHDTEPTPSVCNTINTFRGRINSTYTQNSNWFAKKSDPSTITCRYGDKCRYKNNPVRKCKFKH